MHNLKTIITKLKETLAHNTKEKVLDKDIASALNIKPSALASFKRRDKPPYKAILTYCHDNRLDVRKILFNDNAIICYPTLVPVEDGKVRVRYFRTLDKYSHYLRLHEEV